MQTNQTTPGFFAPIFQFLFVLLLIIHLSKCSYSRSLLSSSEALNFIYGEQESPYFLEVAALSIQ